MKRFETRRLRGIGMQVLASASLLLAGASALADTPLLTPRQAIAGARIEAAIDMMAPIQRRPEFAGYLAWMSPTAIAARSSYLFVFDSGRQQIFRYDLVRQIMTAFAPYPAARVTSLAVAPDLSVYAADVGGQKVLHFSRDGKLLQTFGNARELAQPVALAFDEISGQVWVADGLYNQVAVFNSLGLLLNVIKPSETRSIAAMARGPQGLYLVDRIGRQIVVMGRDGLERPGFGADSLKDPAAIAVDRHGRVFVADNFDRSIKVYKEGQLVASFGGSGATPVLFSRIGGMWLEENTLYVADSLNGRVQSFGVAPPDQEGPK